MRVIFALIFSLCSLCIFAEEDRYVVLPEETVHKGDYFAAGSNIEVSGIVKGDVFVFGSQIVIDGEVEGDVIAAGGSVDITGVIKGSIRSFGGQIEISGVVGENVTVFGGSLQLSPQSLIGGNLVFTGGVIDLDGSVQKNANLSASNARISGKIQGNVKVTAGQLRVGSRAVIIGNLEYSSTNEATIAPGAEIKGEVIYKPSIVKEFFKGRWKEGILYGYRITGILMHFLFCFVVGWIFIRLFPKKLKGVHNALQKRPWKAFWVGLIIAVLLPIACLILFITILGFPLALALLALSLLGFYGAKIIPIYWVSNAILPKIGLRKGSLLLFSIGLVLFFLIIQIPIFGGLVTLVFTFLGLGAFVLGRLPKRSAPKKRVKKKA